MSPYLAITKIASDKGNVSVPATAAVKLLSGFRGLRHLPALNAGYSREPSPVNSDADA